MAWTCHNCGKRTSAAGEFCPTCGVQRDKSNRGGYSGPKEYAHEPVDLEPLKLEVRRLDTTSKHLFRELERVRADIGQTPSINAPAANC